MGNYIDIDDIWEHAARRVDKSASCWLFKGARSSNGYGSLRWGSETLTVHRVAYEALVGPIPDGLVIDHLCRVRHCVNPEHLEPVTQEENVRRGIGSWANRTSPSACPKGHEFTPENTISRRSGGRVCRSCKREAARLAYQAKKATAA